LTLPGSSETLGTGGVIATQTVSAKEYQVIMAADPDGHIQGTSGAYLLYQQPRATTAAATDFFDLFNATGSGKIIRIRGIWCHTQITAAVTATTSFQFSLIRTSAVGTAGTTATFEGAAAPAAGLLNISRLSTNDAGTLPAQITARALPTGGATASHFLFNIFLGSEETALPQSHQVQVINWLPELPYATPFELQENQGIKMRQITATVAGYSIGWLMAFTVVP
jgi:hypothetical protein